MNFDFLNDFIVALGLFSDKIQNKIANDWPFILIFAYFQENFQHNFQEHHFGIFATVFLMQTFCKSGDQTNNEFESL